MIARRLFKESLFTLNQFPVLGIIGPRQCGKTTLAKALGAQSKKETELLDLESPRDLAKLNDAQLFFETNREKLVIIDEIQHRPELFNILRAEIDAYKKPGRFIILGSASPALLRGTADSLAGRVGYLELSPFDYLEVANRTSKDRHWLIGGYPDVVLSKKESNRERWFTNYIQTYVLRDLGQLGLDISSTTAQRLLSMLSHLHGELMNFSNLSRSLGVSVNTAKKYVEFLEESYLIGRLEPFFTNLKKRLVKSPKFYFRDTGLLHYRHQVQAYDQLIAHPIAGKSWEGYVIEEVRRNLKPNQQVFFYRTQKGAECDLVICKNLTPRMTIEIKLTNAPSVSRGYTEVIKDLKTERNFIITPDSDRFKLNKQVEAIAFTEFIGVLEDA